MQKLNAHLRNSSIDKSALRRLLQEAVDEEEDPQLRKKMPRGDVAPSATRWTGPYYVLKRYNKIHPQVGRVMQLSASEIVMPNALMNARFIIYEKLLFPLEEFIRHMEGDYITISLLPIRVRHIYSLPKFPC
jgi:hypothetical protein